MRGQRRPDVRLFEFGADIEILVVPQHFHASAEAGFGMIVALDIDECIGPLALAPGRIVQMPVDFDRRDSAMAFVLLGLRAQSDTK